MKTLMFTPSPTPQEIEQWWAKWREQLARINQDYQEPYTTGSVLSQLSGVACHAKDSKL